MLTLEIANVTLKIDALKAQEIFSRFEADCHVVNGQPNWALLAKVGDWLSQFGVQATQSVAWQVWWLVYEAIDRMRKAAELEAELSYWYGINAFVLSREQKIGLVANLPRVRAQKQLAEGRYSSIDHQHIYHLTLLATGDQQAAERARLDALERFVDREIAKKAIR